MNDFYQNLNNRFRKYKKKIRICNQSITYLFYILYPLLLIYICLFEKNKLMKFILIPGVSFLLVSFFRKIIKRKRPYEIYNFKPIIKKDSIQNSMPSRHVFSASIIAMCYLYFSMELGILLLIFALLSALLRVIGGVHFMSDVTVGYLFGIFCGLLLFV